MSTPVSEELSITGTRPNKEIELPSSEELCQSTPKSLDDLTPDAWEMMFQDNDGEFVEAKLANESSPMEVPILPISQELTLFGLGLLSLSNEEVETSSAIEELCQPTPSSQDELMPELREKTPQDTSPQTAETQKVGKNLNQAITKETKVPVKRKGEIPENLLESKRPYKFVYAYKRSPAKLPETLTNLNKTKQEEKPRAPNLENPDSYFDNMDPDDELYISCLQKPDDSKTEMCILCYEWFNHATELDAHLKSFHRDNMVLYGCKYCGKQFWARFLRQRHEKLH